MVKDILFKKGDEIITTTNILQNDCTIPKNTLGVVLQDCYVGDTWLRIQWNTFRYRGMHDSDGYGEQGKCWNIINTNHKFITGARKTLKILMRGII